MQAVAAADAAPAPAAAGGGGRRPFPVGVATDDSSGSGTWPYSSAAVAGGIGAFARKGRGGSEGSTAAGGDDRLGHLQFLGAAMGGQLSGEALRMSAYHTVPVSTLIRTPVSAGDSRYWGWDLLGTRVAGIQWVLPSVPCRSSNWEKREGTA